MDAFGGSRVKTLPPEKGVFPLDHDGECKDKMKIFLSCLKRTKGDHFPCKSDSKVYLQCRMDVGLMNKEDLNTLGLGVNPLYIRTEVIEDEKEKKGFIAGLGVVGSNKWSMWS
jgi:cytochrome c oxidase assembly protein subunit 19